jgi:group I intron endonuclease
MFVYVIVNSETLKIYVGKTVRKDLNKYLREKIWDAKADRYRGRSYLFASMKKHSSLVWSIYPLYEGQSDVEICAQEKLLIKMLKSQHPDVGYNLADGGQTGPRGWHHSPESKEKIAEAHRGMKPSLETREKLRKARLGQKLSEETRCKIGKKSLGNTYSLGHKHSEESRRKNSESKRGRKFSEEHLRNLSKAQLGNTHNLGHKLSKETRLKISEAHLRLHKKQLLILK